MRKQTITENWARDQSGFLGASYVCCFWGNHKHLEAFLQAYAVEKTRLEARRAGHDISERQLADGSIKLTINVGGVA